MAILAAVGEESETSPVVEAAYELSTAYDEELVVLHVVPEEEAESHLEELRDIAEFEHMSISHEAERGASFAETVVENTLDDYDRGSISTIGRIGPPAETILSVLASDEFDIRYLVVGGRRRTPVGKALFGDITQEVLLGSDVPVVTVMK